VGNSGSSGLVGRSVGSGLRAFLKPLLREKGVPRKMELWSISLKGGRGYVLPVSEDSGTQYKGPS